MKKSLYVTILVVLFGLVLSACIPVIPVMDVGGLPTVQPTSEPQSTTREAQVQSVQIQVMGSNPQQINAVVRGSLTQSCARLGQSQVQYAANTFQITVYEISPADRGCAQVITPFETTIALNTNGLPAGAYTVIANGVGAVFTLQPADPAPTTAPTVAPTAVPTSRGCTDSAKFIADVTMPDNTQVAPETAFTKVWRLKNTGSCAWNSDYAVWYITGTTMSQSPAYKIMGAEERVEPGQTVDVRVGMTAPMQNGNYISYWGLKGRNGGFMPIQGGANGNSFFVKIKVNDGSVPPGNITASDIDIELEQGSGVACTPESTYFVDASITADGPTTATYEIGSTAGQISAGYFQTVDSTDLKSYIRGSMVFDQAGTKKIVLRFVGPYPYPDNISVFIIVNGGVFHSTAHVSCQ